MSQTCSSGPPFSPRLFASTNKVSAPCKFGHSVCRGCRPWRARFRIHRRPTKLTRGIGELTVYWGVCGVLLN